jgi:hypothetical protein
MDQARHYSRILFLSKETFKEEWTGLFLFFLLEIDYPLLTDPLNWLRNSDNTMSGNGQSLFILNNNLRVWTFRRNWESVFL